ncbi:hypothetical protein like AT1G03820 [Hibiscus trionum]|uniref:Protein E6-like n=1 Tax=Hibiscus trionum TaxID=183268 RepID=A0A9W7JJX3_HIBTR|nr:hypothetical protein like AT1G03820 [Hibiscus trionum]
MASLAKPIALFLFLVLSSSVNVQARESKFFSKFIHLGAKISPLESPAVAPVLAPTPAPALAPTDIGTSQDPYYGLYGHGSGMFPPAEEGVTTSNTPTTTTSTFENDLFAEELADERYETGYEKNNNNNGYTTSNYNNNNNNYNDNGYETETERQGMSDTRFVEGGKYYYNVKKENYYPNGDEFSSSEEASKNEGYYGNTENSMEDVYQGRQEEYVP